MRRAFKIPTVRGDDFFHKQRNCVAESILEWDFSVYQWYVF